jgi:hypothetical protein
MVFTPFDILKENKSFSNINTFPSLKRKALNQLTLKPLTTGIL